MLDQFEGLLEHFGHVGHVEVSDIGAEQNVETGPERIHAPVEGPGVDRIVGLASEVEIAGEEFAEVLRRLDAACGVIVDYRGAPSTSNIIRDWATCSAIALLP